MKASFRWVVIMSVLSAPLFAQTLSPAKKKHSSKAAPAASQQDVQSLRDLVEAQQKQIEAQTQQMQQLQDQLHQVLDSVQRLHVLL